MSRTRFRVNPHSIVAWMSRNSLLEAGMEDHLGRKQALNHLAQPIWLKQFGHMAVRSFPSQSSFTL